MEITSAVGAVLGAFGLSGAAGLNAWLPLFVVGVADRMGWIDLGQPYHWLSSTLVLAGIAVLLVVDLVCDKIPAVDSAIHALGTVIAPTSGGILFAADTSLNAHVPTAVAAVLGAVVAGGVHVGRSTSRPLVTGTTAGVGNPVVSILEDVSSMALTVLALVVPIAAFVVVVALLIGLGWLGFRAVRWARSRRNGRRVEPSVE
ncbi:DUF4126 domain-containing protein [Nocardia macrotermitis]|uniref:DUF4126 domain-containing protein n=1 Tax=Nocardia macrotermitis TaxID=2585198 RepID=A0A7K0DB88_9NOCA|nr:DUF4126 domain-containing protein [Nocardia macrotermitis]MQY22134.1 hypothetical protein [Nocardia macrotermitis]